VILRNRQSQRSGGIDKSRRDFAAGGTIDRHRAGGGMGIHGNVLPPIAGLSIWTKHDCVMGMIVEGPRAGKEVNL
jgi:hypothetical protein